MVDMNRLREYLQRSKDGLQYALDNGDEAMADQHMAAADRLGSIAENISNQPQEEQEAPPQGIPQEQAPPLPEKGMAPLDRKMRRLIVNDPDFRSGLPTTGPQDYISPEDAKVQSVRQMMQGASAAGGLTMPFMVPPETTKTEIPMRETPRPEKDWQVEVDEVLGVPGHEQGQESPFVEDLTLPGQEQSPEQRGQAEVDNMGRLIKLYTGYDLNQIDTAEKRNQIIQKMAASQNSKKPSLFSWENLLILLFAGPGAVVQKYMAEQGRYASDVQEDQQQAAGQFLNPLYAAVREGSLSERQNRAMDIKELQAKAVANGLGKHPQYVKYNRELAALENRLRDAERELAKSPKVVDRVMDPGYYDSEMAAKKQNVASLQNQIKDLGDLMISWYEKETEGQMKRLNPAVPQLP